MVGAFPPTIKPEKDDCVVDRYFAQFEKKGRKIMDYMIYVKLLEEKESRIRELEAQLETLSLGVTRG